MINFFYSKSVRYGYGRNAKGPLDPVFGDRNKDLRDLAEREVLLKNGNSNVLGVSTDVAPREYYTIALIGDSLVWGMGLLNNNRLAKVLSDELNKHRKTKVMSFGQPAFSVADYAVRYNLVSSLYHVDLYIFLIVINDTLIGEQRDYSINGQDFVKDCIKKFSSENLVWEPTTNITHSEYQELIEESWESGPNQCVLDEALKRLPSKNATYLMTAPIGDKFINMYYSKIINSGKKAVLMENGKHFQKYKKAWQTSNLFSVSKLDSHPSKLAVQMFTDILTEEILTGDYGFTK